MSLNLIKKFYSQIFITLGVLLVLSQLPGLTEWTSMQYLTLMALSLLGSALQVSYRVPQGLIPLHFLFILISLRTLPLPESVVLAFISSAIYGSRSHRDDASRTEEALFEGAIAALATLLAQRAMYQWNLLGQQEWSAGVGLVLGGAAFFIGLAFPEASRDALLKRGRLSKLFLYGLIWKLPYVLVLSILSGIFERANHVLPWQLCVLVGLMAYLVINSYRVGFSRVEESLHHSQEVANLHFRTVRALALAIEAKDSETRQHLSRVQVYAQALGEKIGLPPAEMEALKAASILHDIGKVAVPEHIIAKPGRLTPAEFEKMKVHPVVGAGILSEVGFPYPVVPIVRSHHEKWNGTGYPDGSSGEEIPLGARILAVVDCLDALTSDRHYRKAMTTDDALAFISSQAGQSFDNRVVELLIRHRDELEARAAAAVAALADETPGPKLELVRGSAPGAGFEVWRTDDPSDADGAGQRPSKNTAWRAGKALYALAIHAGQSVEPRDFAMMAALKARNLVQANAAVIWWARGSHLTALASCGEGLGTIADLEIPLGQGLSGWVAENSRPIVNGNPAVEPGCHEDGAMPCLLGSALSVPLRSEHDTYGAISLYSRAKDAFSEEDLNLLQAFASQLAPALEIALHMPVHSLNSGPSAEFYSLLERTARAVRSRNTCAGLAVFDVGAESLATCVARVSKFCRTGEFAEATSPSEVTVLLQDTAPEPIQKRYEELLASLPVWIAEAHGTPVPIPTSFALFPRDARDVDEWLMAVGQGFPWPSHATTPRHDEPPSTTPIYAS